MTTEKTLAIRQQGKPQRHGILQLIDGLLVQYPAHLMDDIIDPIRAEGLTDAEVFEQIAIRHDPLKLMAWRQEDREE